MTAAPVAPRFQRLLVTGGAGFIGSCFVRDILSRRDGRSITAALYEAGFASSSRFYESAAATLGMRPSEYRSGAPGEPIRFARLDKVRGLVRGIY